MCTLLGMKPIKLPRKRKKAFIKKHGLINYCSMTIVCKVLCETEDSRQNRSYYDYKQGKYMRPVIAKRW